MDTNNQVELWCINLAKRFNTSKANKGWSLYLEKATAKYRHYEKNTRKNRNKLGKNKSNASMIANAASSSVLSNKNTWMNWNWSGSSMRGSSIAFAKSKSLSARKPSKKPRMRLLHAVNA